MEYNDVCGVCQSSDFLMMAYKSIAWKKKYKHARGRHGVFNLAV
jgi:hypothetical protein